jgi:putative flippase GtrA
MTVANQSQSLSQTGSRFAAVGVLNTALDVGVFLLLQTWIGVLAANVVSTSAGMCFSFFVNGRVTFKAGPPTRVQAANFFLVTATTMWVVQPIVIYVLWPHFCPLLLAKFLAIGSSVLLNFVGYRTLVWPQHNLPVYDHGNTE